MATPINTLKNWFKTGMFPTQSQFWAWLDSFRHKDVPIPVADILGLNEVLLPFNQHFNDPAAHADLFLKAKIYAFGELQIFHKSGNTGDEVLAGDVVIGFISETKFIKGTYVLGDPTEAGSYNLIEELDF